MTQNLARMLKPFGGSGLYRVWERKPGLTRFAIVRFAAPVGDFQSIIGDSDRIVPPSRSCVSTIFAYRSDSRSCPFAIHLPRNAFISFAPDERSFCRAAHTGVPNTCPLN